jgi:hypothetical protein
MAKITVFLLFILTLLGVARCAAVPTASYPGSSQPEIRLSPEAKAELERRQIEKAREEQEAFEAFGAKMDEYHDLLAFCDSISSTGEAAWLKDACYAKLKRLEHELTDPTAARR